MSLAVEDYCFALVIHFIAGEAQFREALLDYEAFLVTVIYVIPPLTGPVYCSKFQISLCSRMHETS